MLLLNYCTGLILLLSSNYQIQNVQCDPDVTSYALNLLKNVSAIIGPKNVIISPMSIQLAAAMALYGSAGETRNELGCIFFNKADQSCTEYEAKDANKMRLYLQSFVKLSEFISQKPSYQRFYKFQIANYALLDKSLSISDEYKTELHNTVKAKIEQDDFAANGPVIEKRINDQIKNDTNGKIDGIVPAGSINQATPFLLINAIYLKAVWKMQFSEKDSNSGSFWVSQEKSDTVQYMNIESNFLYFEDKNMKVLQLPFVNIDRAQGFMFIVLPTDQTLDKLLPDLNKGNLLKELLFNSFQTMDKYAVTVKIPKFKIEYSENIVDVLKSMGVRKAFDESAADFSAITNSKNKLSVSNVYHKGFIEVSESGIEAAAATQVGLEDRIFGSDPIGNRTFIANRPFAFFVTMKTFDQMFNPDSETILFAGQFLRNEL